MDEALWSFYDNEANKVNPAANLSGLVIDCGSVAVYKTLFMTGTTACKDGLHYDSEVTLDMMDFELWIIAVHPLLVPMNPCVTSFHTYHKWPYLTLILAGNTVLYCRI